MTLLSTKRTCHLCRQNSHELEPLMSSESEVRASDRILIFGDMSMNDNSLFTVHTSSVSIVKLLVCQFFVHNGKLKTSRFQVVIDIEYYVTMCD